MIEFKYRENLKVTPDKKLQVIARPNAVVTITNGRNSVEFNMLVDSGSDISAIPKSAGDKLGLKIKEGETIGTIEGIGGSISVVPRKLSLTIGEYKFSAAVVWAFTDDIPLILGRADVFDYFRIEFLQDIEIVRFHKAKQ